MQNEIGQKEKNKYKTSLVCGIQKYSRKEHICKNRDREKVNKCMGTKGGGECGVSWEAETGIYTLLCVKWIAKENLLYSRGNCTQGSAMTYTGRKSEKECTY